MQFNVAGTESGDPLTAHNRVNSSEQNVRIVFE